MLTREVPDCGRDDLAVDSRDSTLTPLLGRCIYGQLEGLDKH